MCTGIMDSVIDALDTKDTMARTSYPRALQALVIRIASDNIIIM